MTRRHENAVIDVIDIEIFQASDGDGTGDVRDLEDEGLAIELGRYGYRWLRVDRS